MKLAAYRAKKEDAIRAAVGGQLNQNSREITGEVTSEIVLMARKLTHIFLGEIFRNIFSTERSCEYSAPVVFQIGESTDLILYDRLNAIQLQKLPYYIMNEEVMAKSFHPMREVNFVLLVDLSLSMLYRWPLTELAATNQYVSGSQARNLKEKCRQTKLYALKYLAYAFLDSAIKNGFKTSTIFFSNQTEHEIQSANDKMFPLFVLHYIDEHFSKVYAKAVSTNQYSEKGGYLDVLLNFVYKRKKCVVLFLSDFLDGIKELKPYLIELSYRGPLIMGIINDPLEVNFPSRKLLTPVNITYEHCKNMEENMGEGVRLSNEVIREYNLKAAQRRQDISDFLNHRKIKCLDIQTQDNYKIPQKLQKLSAQLLGEL